MLNNFSKTLQELTRSFQFEPFSKSIQPIIEEVLSEHNRDKDRKGTKLTSIFLVWIVLGLTLRRDLSYPKLLNWLVSGIRWTSTDLPYKLVECGTISHARVKLGVTIFRDIFFKFVAKFKNNTADFYTWTTVMFDGTSLTMPDTESNRTKFGKHKTGRGKGAFPQMRAVALMILSQRVIIDIAYAAIKGKKTGERTLMMQILKKVNIQNLLFLFDAGFYSFFLAWHMIEKRHDFIMKMSKNVKLPVLPKSKMPDGSYLSVLKGKIEDPSNPNGKRKKWKEVQITVRVIIFQIPGFQPVRLITTLLDSTIEAKIIVIHYHKRWDIEIAYDEIKTHQCATLKGHEPTIFRSKRADLVEQELYAMLTIYNLTRNLISEAANKHSKNPLHISFLDTLQLIFESTPLINIVDKIKKNKIINYLLRMIAASLIDRPRRHRSNPRVVKRKMSNFKRKRKTDKSEYRNFEEDIEIIPMLA